MSVTKKKMLTPRFDVEMIERIQADAKDRGLSVNAWLVAASEGMLPSKNEIEVSSKLN